MVEYSAEASSQLDSTLHTLADPTRRAILDALADGEKRVCEIASPFSMSLNAVSKHIKKLEQAGLVQRRRSGREHYLSANPQPLQTAADWFDQQRTFWGERLDLLEKLLEQEISDE